MLENEFSNIPAAAARREFDSFEVGFEVPVTRHEPTGFRMSVGFGAPGVFSSRRPNGLTPLSADCRAV